MIKSLQIKNFQSHKDTELEFDPGVNIIVGSSDSGKTAIIRALRWAVFNRPQGDGFRSHWGGDTKVVVQFDDCTITRKKDKQDEYLLNDKSFKAFRTDVPQEIIEALRMDSVNLQSQLDAPYLLSETAGAVAAHFNKVARLDKIDKGLYNVQSALRSLGSEVKHKTKDIGDTQDQLKQYENLPKIEAHVEVVEELYEKYMNAVKRKSKLDSILLDLETKEEEIHEASSILTIEPIVDKLLQKLTLLKRSIEEQKKLNHILHFLEEIEEALSKGNQLILCESLVLSLIDLYNKIKRKRKEHVTFSNLMKSINDIERSIINKDDYIKRKTIEFEKLFPNQCPLCGTQIK